MKTPVLEVRRLESSSARCDRVAAWKCSASRLKVSSEIGLGPLAILETATPPLERGRNGLWTRCLTDRRSIVR